MARLVRFVIDLSDNGVDGAYLSNATLKEIWEAMARAVKVTLSPKVARRVVVTPASYYFHIHSGDGCDYCRSMADDDRYATELENA